MLADFTDFMNSEITNKTLDPSLTINFRRNRHPCPLGHHRFQWSCALKKSRQGILGRHRCPIEEPL